MGCRDRSSMRISALSIECCYCGFPIGEKTLSQDHLVPMNKARLGLHAWDNVLNHVAGHKSGVADIYKRASYLDEKRVQ